MGTRRPMAGICFFTFSLLFFVLLIGLCISTAFPTCPLPDVTIHIQISILIIDKLVGGTLDGHICIN